MPIKEQPQQLRTSRRDLLRAELGLLSSLLANRITFRHHVWYRHCRLALHRCKKVFKSCQSFSKACRCIERAAAECVAELRQVRVDTVGLTTALLAVLARLHLLFSVDDKDIVQALRDELTVTTRDVAPARRRRDSVTFKEALQVELDDTLDAL